jgi:hypothetical protein
MRQPKLFYSAIGTNKSWAGQPLEKITGRAESHLLRTLHVSDLFVGSGRRPADCHAGLDDEECVSY